MLLSYSFENFGPFKDRAHFSMLPGTRMNRYRDNEVEFDRGFRVSKSAVVVGENGGGKTTIAKSMKQLQQLISTANKTLRVSKNTINANLQENYPVTKQCYELEALILVETTDQAPPVETTDQASYYIYHFILELNGFGIVKEYLGRRLIGKTKEELLYHVKTDYKRDADSKVVTAMATGTLNPKYFTASDSLKESIQKFQMGIVLNRVAGFCPEVIVPFIKWITDCLVIKCTEFADLSVYSDLNFADTDEQTLDIIQSQEFFDLFRLVDPTILQIKVDPKEPYKATKIIRMDENGQKYSIQLIEESTGIREFFCWAEQLWKIINENKTLFADEIDRVLNPVLAAKLVAYINNSEHHGQFIFTTHNALHLNFRDFRKEQMWIVSKSHVPLSSELYSIADFDGVRYNNKTLYKQYLNGYFGGIGNG